MNKKNFIFCILLMLFGACQSLIASDQTIEKALEDYCNRPCVKVICCNPQGFTQDYVWMKCDTTDHAMNSSLNVACCIPRCLIGSLCCACFGVDFFCYSIQEASTDANDSNFVGGNKSKLKLNRERSQEKLDAMESIPSSQNMENRSAELNTTLKLNRTPTDYNRHEFQESLDAAKSTPPFQAMLPDNITFRVEEK